MHSRGARVGIAISLLLTSLGAAASQPEPRTAPTDLAAVIANAAGELPAGGMVAGELREGKTRFFQAGSISVAPAVPPERIIFEIGSISKVFTGLLLAQATLDGKASLDDPIRRHLPPDLELEPRVAAITLEQLASHTSGLPRLPDNLAPANTADPYADYTVERLYAFLRSHRLAEPAPRPYDYSNLGVGLLGHLLTRMYGVSYEELVRRKIAEPAGLVDTTVQLSAEQARRFAPPFSGTRKVSPWALDALAGAGALRSTAADLLKFAEVLMDPEGALARPWAIARELRHPMHERARIGLGVFAADRAGEIVYQHGGGTGGFRSFLEWSPATRRARVILINNDSPDAAAVAALTRTRARAETASGGAQQTTTPITPVAAAEYAGVYTIDARGRFTVVLDAEGQLRIRLTGQSFGRVTFMGNDRFRHQAVAAEFQFGRNAAGRIDSLTLHQNGREIRANRSADAPAILFPSAAELAAYAGIYELAPNAVFEVTTRGDTLFAKLTGQPALPVHKVSADRFEYDVVVAALVFERDASGAVTALVLHQNGLEQRAKRVSGAK